MSTPIKIFEANQSSIFITLALSVSAALMSLLAFWYLNRKEVVLTLRQHRQLGIMLLGLVFLIASGAAIGSLVNLKRLRPVEIYEDKVSTGFGVVAYKDLRFVYLHQGRQPSFVSPDITVNTTLLAYFEEKKGKSYVLSSEHYDVRGIVAYIRPKLDAMNAE